MAETEKKTTAKKTTTAKTAEKAAKPATKAAPKAKKGTGCKTASVESRLQVKYKNEILPELMKEFGYSSVMQAPKLIKVVVNMGIGEATANSKAVEESVKELTQLAGQKPVVTRAKKSVANFKLREKQAVGAKVTLRGVRMYDFLDKLMNVALPRVRDFRGISKNSFDGRGNYALGVKEQYIFPEIDYDKVTRTQGMDIIIVTSAKTDKEALSLLTKFGMPYRR